MLISSPKGDPRYAFIAVDDLCKKIGSAKKYRSLNQDLRTLRDLVGELVEVAHDEFILSLKPDLQIGEAGEGEHLLVGESQLANGTFIRAANDVDRNIFQVWVEETGYFSKKKQYSCVREFNDLASAYDYMERLTVLLSEPKKAKSARTKSRRTNNRRKR